MYGYNWMTTETIQSFLHNRLQRVELNGQTSAWTSALAGDTSIFSVINDINVSANQMNKALQKISMWAYQ